MLGSGVGSQGSWKFPWYFTTFWGRAEAAATRRRTRAKEFIVSSKLSTGVENKECERLGRTADF